MSDVRTILERGYADATPPPDGFERMLRRRDRKRRNQRITAGVVGIAVFVAAVWVVTTGGSLHRSETPAVSGSAETGPAVSNCVVTRCTETGPVQPTPTPPVLIAPPTTGYLIDLNTGEMTQLPKSIDGFGYVVSPDGTMVAYTSQGDAGTGQVFIASPDGTDVQQVTHGRRVTSVTDWSPDGEAIAFTRVSGAGDVVTNIFVLDLATGETRQVTNVKPPSTAFAPQFSPDGDSIIYVYLHSILSGWSSATPGSAGLRVVPVAGGKSVRLVGGYKTNVTAGSGTFSPDGSTLAMMCGPRLGWGICIADAQGTNPHLLVNGRDLFSPRWSPDGTRIAYTYGPTDTDFKVFVVDVATGETTFVAEGIADDWLDDHTLIIETVPR
jgi:Tol biopolymer transport system component